jgi:enterochelin esterase-like enzyme
MRTDPLGGLKQFDNARTFRDFRCHRMNSRILLLAALLCPCLSNLPLRADDTTLPSGMDQVREVPHGQVSTNAYDSKSLGFERRLTVYTPPGYATSKKYPVLYLLHGSGDNETGWLVKGSANVILDNLLADKKMVPMIVVMPNGFANRPGQARPGRDASPEDRRKAATAFEDDLLKDIIPWVEGKYSVQSDPAHRALAGLSMGGGQTMRIGPVHPDTFSHLGVFSAGVRKPTDGTQAQVDVTANYPEAKKLNAALKLFWVSCGDRDPGIEGARNFDQILTAREIRHVWHQDSGAHEWPVWKNDLYLLSQKLFQ